MHRLRPELAQKLLCGRVNVKYSYLHTALVVELLFKFLWYFNARIIILRMLRMRNMFFKKIVE